MLLVLLLVLLLVCYVDDVVGLLYYLCYCWFVTLIVLLILFPFIFLLLFFHVWFLLHCMCFGEILPPLPCWWHIGGYHVIVCLPSTKVQLICYIVSVVIKIHCVLQVPWWILPSPIALHKVMELFYNWKQRKPKKLKN